MKFELNLHEVKIVQGGLRDCYSVTGKIVASKSIYDNSGQPGTAKTNCRFFCCERYGAEIFSMNGYDRNLCNPPRLHLTTQDWQSVLYS